MSFLTAPIIARKIGVVRTMAFSHGLASVNLVLPAAGADVCDRRRDDDRSLLSGLHGQSTAAVPSSWASCGPKIAARPPASPLSRGMFRWPISPTISAYLMQAFRVERADIYRRLPAVLSRLRLLFHVPRRETARRTRGYVANRDGLIMGLLRNLHRDAKLLMASRGIRAFAFSYLNVVFAIYLDRLGYYAGDDRGHFHRRLSERRRAHRALGIFVGSGRSQKNFNAACDSDDPVQRSSLFILAVSSLFWLQLSSRTSAPADPAAAARAAVRSIPSKKLCWRRNAGRRIAIRSSRSIRASARSWAL